VWQAGGGSALGGSSLVRHEAFTGGARRQCLEVRDVHQPRRAEAQESAWGQLRGHRGEGVVDAVRYLPNVERHAIIGGFQPLDIRHPQKEHEAIGVQGDLLLRARFGAETVQQVLCLLQWRAVERSGNLARRRLLSDGCFGWRGLAWGVGYSGWQTAR
jgi:hypothetical protein